MKTNPSMQRVEHAGSSGIISQSTNYTDWCWINLVFDAQNIANLLEIDVRLTYAILPLRRRMSSDGGNASAAFGVR